MTLIIPPYRPFEFGESYEAKMAIENYKNYNSKNDYVYLKDCFVNLARVQSAVETKTIAAEAANALARLTFDKHKDIYKKCFIANSADSALMRAKLDNQYWNERFKDLSSIIVKNGLDPLCASKAGLGIFTKQELREARLVFVADKVVEKPVIPAGTLKVGVPANEKGLSGAFSGAPLLDQTLPEEKSTQNPTNDVLITTSESNIYDSAGIAVEKQPRKKLVRFEYTANDHAF